MKKLNLLFALIFISGFSVFSSAITVQITSPVSGSTVSSPAKIYARASSGHRITGWWVYVDGVGVYSTGATTNISPSISMSAGTHKVTVRAWNGTGAYASAYLTLTVPGSTPAPTVSVSISPSSAALQAGASTQFNASVSGATNTAVSWLVNGTQGGNSTVGTVSTTGLYQAPAAVPSGSSVTVTAKSMADTTKSASASVSIVASPTTTPIAITTSTLPAATVGTAYRATLTATGGTAPYIWSMISGQLPAGLTLSSSGAITGTPTAAGTASFTVQGKDSAASPQAATRAESIAVTTQSSGATPPPQAAGYHLAFADEFDSLSLSPTRLGNYTWYDGWWWNGTVAPLSNISASNGILNLIWDNQQGTSHTSVSSVSKDGQYHHAWRYGYAEVRMKWDVTAGSWPAIWLLPVQDITGASVINGVRETGELDLFEGQAANPHTFFGTIHDWKNGADVGHNSNNAYQLPSTTDFSQYHTYGVLWTPGRVTWYFDNQLLFSAPTYPVFDQQDYYLILGSQEGVNWSYGNLSGVTASKIGMYVDWVRVWQQ